MSVSQPNRLASAKDATLLSLKVCQLGKHATQCD